MGWVKKDEQNRRYPRGGSVFVSMGGSKTVSVKEEDLLHVHTASLLTVSERR